MTVVVDINVLLDVFQKRQPHYADSGAFLNLITNKSLQGASILSDFEDAAVAITAEKVKAAFIVTRNEADFVQSRVPVISPSACLSRFAATP